MSEHFVKRNEPPVGISSFTKIRLGWISAEQVHLVHPGETDSTFLSPLAKKGDTLVVKIPLRGSRYYLVENRQPVGYDRSLPDSGILILKVNPEAMEGSGTVQVMNANPNAHHFSQASFRLDQKNRNCFRDEKNNIAILPLWSEGEKQGVLITTPEKSAEALHAAMLIQRLLYLHRDPVKKEERQLIEDAMASFKRFDFKGCAQIAQQGFKD